MIAQRPHPQTKKPAQLQGSAHDPVLEMSRQVAAMLGESDFPVFCQIYATVKSLGRDRVLDLLRATLEIEQSGGQQIPDGSRRRTPGGVFFKLARERYNDLLSWHPGRSAKKKQTTTGQPETGSEAGIRV